MRKLFVLTAAILLAGCSNDPTVQPTLEDVLYSQKWFASGGYLDNDFTRPEMPVYEFEFKKADSTYNATIFDGPCEGMRDYPLGSQNGSLRLVYTDSLVKIGILKFRVLNLSDQRIDLKEVSSNPYSLILFADCEGAWNSR